MTLPVPIRNEGVVVTIASLQMRQDWRRAWAQIRARSEKMRRQFTPDIANIASQHRKPSSAYLFVKSTIATTAARPSTEKIIVRSTRCLAAAWHAWHAWHPATGGRAQDSHDSGYDRRGQDQAWPCHTSVSSDLHGALPVRRVRPPMDRRYACLSLKPACQLDPAPAW